ncbi:MAG: OmpA family protein [Cyanobacteriota bacterium]|nr:OmpA family protein [Cyanobacteriota bacterium]
MTSSKKDSSSLSPLEGLLDLLIDLQVVNPTQKPSEESPTLTQEAVSEGNPSSADSVEDYQNLPTDSSPVMEPESESSVSLRLKEEQQEEPAKPSPLGEVNLNQAENADKETPPELKLTQLIQSYQQKDQPKDWTNSSPVGTDGKEIDNSITLFERWQRLLMTQELMDSRGDIVKLKEKLQSLEHQIYEPTEFINLLLPLITEVLTRKVGEAREEVAQAIAPIVAEMIQAKTQQDKEGMSSALAPILPSAVAQQVSNSPGDFARALGPEMGTAIKEQISLERDAMVDALYPVIGSTISKYMAEAIKSINEKVENTLSVEGISRKIRAKMQGVSEAELIFKESMPFTVQAIFLIHKGSGLIISEVQSLESHYLESEMVAGMLTAIRSFVNDCIAQSGDISEIDQIEYGTSKITLEVAGYCYLAAVTQGEQPRSFMQKMRSALGAIVHQHGKSIESFDGDPAKVPEQVQQILESLTELSQPVTQAKQGKPPVALVLIGLAVVSAIVLPWGLYQYHTGIDRRIQEEISLALASDPELAVYRLVVDANRGTIKLTGRLPNQYLRSKAEQIAKNVQPKLKIQNATIPVELPADPVLAAGEVQRVTNILNQMEGAAIEANYQAGKVTVQGTVLQEADAREITKAFQQIPGVQSVTNTVQLQALAIASRVYFEPGSSELKPGELSKVSQLKAFLDQYPNKHLRLLGHTDSKGSAKDNQQLALERATKVKDVLVTQGVDSKRVEVMVTTDAPLGVKADQLPLFRCVEFQIIAP